MKVIKLPKKSGGYRTIHVPSRAERRQYRELLPALNALAMKLDVHNVSHGFMPGRSAVTNAKFHVGPWGYTVSFDLKDFFDTVDVSHMYFLANEDLAELNRIITGKGCLPARQGLPTSPAIANIAFSSVDKEIMYKGLSNSQGPAVVYSRYADDLTFSCDNIGNARWVMKRIPEIVSAFGFEINPRKTRVQSAKVGRRVITGVAVDDKGIYPTRATRRKLRAARHAGNASQSRGLEEWSQLRSPGGWRNIKAAVRSYRGLLAMCVNSPSKYLTEQMLKAENALEVAAYRAGMDPREAVSRAIAGLGEE